MKNYNEILNYHEKNLVVNEKPYPHLHIEKFLPEDYVNKIAESFKLPRNLKRHDQMFQKTKQTFNILNEFPNDIKNLVNYLHSKEFIKILENKFNIKSLVADPLLQGGGMHQSGIGGYLKIHSDFIYLRKRKLKRRLNLLLYLNDVWEENWGGAIELWNPDMSKNFLKVYPKINNCVMFRTDLESNHGFPDPINCPLDQFRKSIAIYYYTEDRNYFFKFRKYYFARWKRRPNIIEPQFGDNQSKFRRFLNRYLFRFNFKFRKLKDDDEK